MNNTYTLIGVTEGTSKKGNSYRIAYFTQEISEDRGTGRRAFQAFCGPLIPDLTDLIGSEVVADISWFNGNATLHYVQEVV